MPGLLGTAASAQAGGDVSPLERPMTEPSVTEPGSFDTTTLTISTGGTYSGLARRVTGTVNAVTVTTSQPVVIEDSWLEHERGAGVQCWVTNADVTVRNSVIKANHPGGTGVAKGRSINLQNVLGATIEHNWLEHGGGIYSLAMPGGVSGRMVVRYNQGRNIDGRHSNGAGGYSTHPDEWVFAQFCQMNQCQGMRNVDIGWNEVVCLPFQCRVEDVVNMYESSGVDGDPLDIHHNVIWGAYPTAVGNYYFGGGIMGSDGADNTNSRWGLVRDNRVMGTTNHGVSLLSGTDGILEANRVVSSGRSEAGDVFTAANLGVQIWDLHAAGGFDRNDSIGNFARWWRHHVSQRNDFWFGDCGGATGCCEGTCTVTNGTPSGEVTWADELAEWDAWWNTDRPAAAVTAGPSGW